MPWLSDRFFTSPPNSALKYPMKTQLVEASQVFSRRISSYDQSQGAEFQTLSLWRCEKKNRPRENGWVKWRVFC